jgi:phage baseplate assembly protein W
MLDVKDFLGVGWTWPVRTEAGPDEKAGEMSLSGYEERIRQSILIILGTARGERIMRPEFGCGIHDLVFAPNDATTEARVGYEVREALLDFEPRIDVDEVRVTRETPERMVIEVLYRVRRTNNTFNLVYPFFLERSGA